MKKLFKSKRWIALFLALLLIVTTCVSSTDAFLWASQEDEASKEGNMLSEETKEFSFDEEESSEDESVGSIETEVSGENDSDPDYTDSTGTEINDENNDGSGEGEGLDEEDEVTDPDEALSPENPDEMIGSNDAAGDENVTYSYVIKYYFYNEETSSYEEDEAFKVTGEGKEGAEIPVADSEGDRKVHNGLEYVFDHVGGSDKITKAENIAEVYYMLKVGDSEEKIEDSVKKEEYIEQTISNKAEDGASVTVSGMLPNDAKLNVKLISETDVSELVKEAIINEDEEKTLSELKAYDITVTDETGNKIDLAEEVKVTIDGSGITGDVAVYYINGSSAVKVAEGNSFTTDHFSTWAIASRKAAVKRPSKAPQKAVPETLNVKVVYVNAAGNVIASPADDKITSPYPISVNKEIDAAELEEASEYAYVGVRYGTSYIRAIMTEEDDEGNPVYYVLTKNGIGRITVEDLDDIELVYSVYKTYDVSYEVQLEGRTLSTVEAEKAVTWLGEKRADSAERGQDFRFSVEPKYGYDIKQVTANGKGINLSNGGYKVEEVMEDLKIVVEIQKSNNGGKVHFEGPNTRFSYGGDNNINGSSGVVWTGTDKTYEVGNKTIDFSMHKFDQFDDADKILNKLSITLTYGDEEETISLMPPANNQTTEKSFSSDLGGVKVTLRREGETNPDYWVTIYREDGLCGDFSIAANYKNAGNSEIWYKDLEGVAVLSVQGCDQWDDIYPNTSDYWVEYFARMGNRYNSDRWIGNTTDCTVMFSVADGYYYSPADRDKITLTVELDGVVDSSYNSNSLVWDGDDYRHWRFTIPASVSAKDIRISIKVEPKKNQFEAKYFNKNNAGGYVCVATNDNGGKFFGLNGSFTVPEEIVTDDVPRLEGKKFVGWELQGPAGKENKLYYSGNTFVINNDNVDYAYQEENGVYYYTFYEVWEDVNELEEVPYEIVVDFGDGNKVTLKGTGPVGETVRVTERDLIDAIERGEYEGKIPENWPLGYVLDKNSQMSVKLDKEGDTPVINIKYNKLSPASLVYDGNGGSSEVYGTRYAVPGSYYEGDKVIVKGQIFYKPGYKFAGWAIDPNGNGKVESGVGYTLAAGENILYAQWTAVDVDYTIVYHYLDPAKGQYTDEAPYIHTEKKKILVGSDVSVDPAVMSGNPGLQKGSYTFDENNVKNVLAGKVLADGTLKLHVYYTIKYTVTGTIDNGGNVTNTNQKVIHGEDSTAMVFTAAEGYIIKTIKVNDGAEQDVESEQKTEYIYGVQTNVQGDITVVVTTVKKNPELTLKKVRTNEPADKAAYKLGEVIEYQITAENTGNVTLSGITVKDELVEKEWEIEGSLEPGEYRTFDVSYTVTEKDIEAGHVVNVATAKIPGNPDPTPDKEDTPVETAKPRLSVEKKAAGNEEPGKKYAVGEKVTYTIKVTNNGNVTITDIDIKDDLTGGSWQVDSLAVGGSYEETTTYTITAADILAGKVVNTVTVTGTAQDADKTSIEETAEETIRTEDINTAYSIDKKIVSEQKEYKVGDTIRYEITVKSNANVVLENIVIKDELVNVHEGAEVTFTDLGEAEEDGGQIKIAELQPGGTVTLKCEYKVTMDDAVLNTKLEAGGAEAGIKNKVTAKPDPVQPTDPDDPDPDPIDPGTEEDEEGPTDVEDVTYTVTGEIDNGGNVTNAEQKVIHGEDSDEMVFTAANDYIIKTIKVNGIDQAVDFDQTTYTYDAQEGVTEDITVVVTTEKKNPRLTLTKVRTSHPEDATYKYQLGEEITYKITATNTGNVTLSGITVKDELVGFEEKIEDNLAPGASRDFNVSYTVTAEDIEAGSVLNEATATKDPQDPGPDPKIDEDEEETPVDTPKPSLFVEKKADGNEAGKTYAEGEEVTYTIRVSNNGNVRIKDIEIEDDLTGESWTIGTLYPKEDVKIPVLQKSSVEETTKYTVTPDDILAGKVVNTVTVTGTANDPDKTPIEEEATETIRTEEIDATYSIEKKIVNKQAEYKVNDTIKYEITVKSNANVVLENIVIKDELVNVHTGAEVTFTDLGGAEQDGDQIKIAELKPGDTVTLRCEYTVTKEDVILNTKVIDAGIKNRVTAKPDKVVPKDPDKDPVDPGEEDDETDPADVEGVYTLTIHYVYATGGTVAPDYVGQYLEGEAYSVFSPTLSGYRWNWTFVAGNMPARDLEVTVAYWLEGGGGDPDPNPDPDPTPGPTGTPTPGPTATPTPPVIPTPPVTPVPPTEPIIIPVEPTLVDVDNEDVPVQGILVDVDDDGNVTLTPITEDKIPLDNRELDDHKCCILSFLLMLLTLIIYTWFTHSMKKNQKKLEEMKDELEEEILKRQLGITDENNNTGKSAQA
ncbi:MAG: hypothetical protein HDR71_19950 [Lachnospiraceae bacterium]|nr:hypothetical protein [Lachnospiraceae bacterium]